MAVHGDVLSEVAHQEKCHLSLLPEVLSVGGAVCELKDVNLLDRLSLGCLRDGALGWRTELRCSGKEEVLDYEQDGLYGQITEDLNKTGDQV